MRTLNFERQTARVIVKVSGFGDEFKDLNPTLSAVEVYSKLKVPAGESDSYAAIKTYKKEESGNNVFYALVSPGDANSTEKFLKLTVTYNDGEGNPTQTKELYVTGIPALDKAMSYTYDVKIGKDKVAIGSVSVTDWSPGDDITRGDAVTTIYPMTVFRLTFSTLRKILYSMTGSFLASSWISSLISARLEPFSVPPQDAQCSVKRHAHWMK